MRVAVLLGIFLSLVEVKAQSAIKIYEDLKKLNFLGSVLYLAAHPDDENTALISYFANQVHAETAYLSLTRGDGGQNRIGTELGELLGVIRTNELLAARKIDGGQQFFSSAIDFGYSKHPKETFRIWNHKKLLGEVIARIRAFQPDLIIHRFDHRTPGTTHGHHTSSAQLGFEAFELSINPNSYPDQLKTLGIWQARRQFYNTSWWRYGSKERFNQIDKSNFLTLEIGTHSPITGRSNNSIAAESRSSHKSQGFGAAPQLGSRKEYIELINGDQPKGNDPFEGINTSWNRLNGGDKIGELVTRALDDFDFTNPSKSIEALVAIHDAISLLNTSVWKIRKQLAVEQLIKDCVGLTLQLNTSLPYATQGEQIEISFNAVQQSAYRIEIVSVGNEKVNHRLIKNEAYRQSLTKELGTTLTTPYWLTEKGIQGSYTINNKNLRGKPETPALQLPVQVAINGTSIVYDIPIQYRVTDPVRGEVVTPFHLLPQVGVAFKKKVQLFPNQEEQDVLVEITNYGKSFSGQVNLQVPTGWTSTTSQKTINLEQRGSSKLLSFAIRPTPKAKKELLFPLVFQNNEKVDPVYTVEQINYIHIPKQYVAQPSNTELVPLQLNLTQKKVGYLMGAGDLVPESLRTLGLEVELIDLDTMTPDKLQSFDTIFVGIRAFNVLESLVYKNELLFDFAHQGGTLVVQYNTNRGLKTKKILPYSINLSRDRVTNERSPVKILEPKHPVFNHPHKITSADFEGWVQERGLYFADKWDSRYIPLLGMNDPFETEKKGSLLIASYGKGTVVYTGLSFFRELPAGVPGAYRLLINLIHL